MQAWVVWLLAIVLLSALVLIVYLASRKEGDTSTTTPAMEEPTLRVPLRVWLVNSDDARYTTELTAAEARDLMQQVSTLWQERANIELDIINVQPITINADTLKAAFDARRPQAIPQLLTPAARRSWNLFFVRSFGAGRDTTHGRTYPHLKTIFVADDIKTVPLVRTTAHEIGHALGLGHDNGQPTHLMSQGHTGTLLTPDEVRRARRAATAAATTGAGTTTTGTGATSVGSVPV